MQRTIEYLITSKDTGKTILEFLKTQGYSRHILSTMKNTGNAISLNGCHGFGRSILKEGDRLNILIPEDSRDEQAILPTRMELSVLYEDEDIMVINKPSNMPVHPSAGNYTNTLANGTAWYFAQKGQNFVFRCINRLDRDTTGALILAKNPLSAAILSAQMKARQIKRTYLALVEGIPDKSGTINAPIARMDGSVITREVNFQTGEPAVTHYECLATGPLYSLLELHLETGRTHQIRVHLNYIGHPLPGDYLYNPDYRKIQHQPLHSYQLEFTHPITKKPMLFTAPVPDDFISAFY